MNTFTERSISMSQIIVSVVGFLVLVSGSTTLLAQQNANKEKSLKQHLKKKQQKLRQKLDLDKRSQQDLATPTGIDLGSLTDQYAMFTKDKSWMFGSPHSTFQTPPDKSGQWAGDINSDGLADYVVRGEPNGPETLVYFGGKTSSVEPQDVLDVWLSPVGDVNGDGFADAVASNGEIYMGTQNGYQPSGSQLPQTLQSTFGRNNTRVVPAGDLDNDGYEDMFYYRKGRFTGPQLIVYWGGDSGSALQNFRDYRVGAPTLDREIRSFVANTGNFDSDAKQEIYIFGRDYRTGENVIRVLDLDSNNNLQQAQEFTVNQDLGGIYPGDFALYVFDINNSGFEEIFISPSQRIRGFQRNYVYKEDSNNAGQFNTTAVDFYTGSAFPVGDLNDDGRVDFHVSNSNTDGAHIAHGPQNISDGLSNDVPLNLTNDSQYYSFNTQFPYTELGDLNDDGVDDYVLGFNDNSSNEIGRAFVFGNGSGDPTTSTALAPVTDFIDQYNGTANVGDVNGDGVEDFAILRSTTNTIEVYFGDETIADEPDLTIDALYEYTATDGGTNQTSAISVTGGDFNNDGFSDIVVGQNVGAELNVYFGGESMDNQVDQEIVGEDFKGDGGSTSVFYFVHNVGDVNNDGIEDFLAGSLLGGAENSDGIYHYYNESYLFLGNSSFPTSPDATIQLSEDTSYTYAGYEAKAIGDMNGDGINDFAVSSPYANGNEGRVDVFYGNSSADFSSPDLTLNPTVSMQGFGYGLAGGDFNADGNGDLAVSRQFVYAEGSSEEVRSNIEVYTGSDSPDNKADYYLQLDPESIGYTDYDFERNMTGQLAAIDDHDGNGADEIAAIINRGTNVTVFSGNLSLTRNQTLVLRAPNSSGSLGAQWNNALGDFTGNGNPGFILQNPAQETNYIDAAHRFGIPNPIQIASVEDVPEDQGGWVRVSTDGYYMDAIDQGIIGFDHWAVWRQDQETMKWTNVATVPAHGTDSKYVDVRVPNTKASGSEADSTNYKFKVTALNSAENTLAASAVDSGYALDNISPNAVTGVAAQRSDSEVSLSWNGSGANDLMQYEILSADNPEGEPLLTTLENNATLSDSDYSGVQELLVRARDIHKNAGETSETALAVFPKELNFEVQSRWNLVGIPLDASNEEISNLESKIKDGTIYKYDGKYISAEQLEPGEGYWVKFTEGGSYSVTGLPTTKQTLDIKKGWNLISGVGEPLSFSEIQDPNDILIKGTLAGFNGAYTDADKLNPASGYWVRASEKGTVTLSLLNNSDNPESQQAKSKNILAEAKKDLNKLELRTENGSKQTLYFGAELPDAVNPLSFSLPPVPLGNSFDARFAGDATSYKKGNQFKVDLQSSNSSKITLDLKLLPTSRHQKYNVQELKDDKVLTEYELSGKESIIIKNKGVTSLKISPVGSSLAQEKPDEFKLQPSYPNPFNPSTTIQYQIPEQVQVRVEVFNMVGKRVRTLLAGEQQEAGIHKIRFNASELSSGVYFVRLQAGSFKQIQKITLIK